jgi:2-dehydropantoate 2-reductase
MVEKSARYIVFGAGAIGIVVGAMLVRAGLRVVFVTRAAQAEALRRGIVIKTEDQEFSVSGDAALAAREINPERDDIILITAKSQATEQAIEELSIIYNRTTPVVCLQNGTRNEEIAARRFDNVYAGLVMLSAVQIEPDRVTLSQGRALAIGCYPSGVDRTARQIATDLGEAGFDCLASPHVMAMKWGKLVANLNNATHTITGYWLELGQEDAEMRRLMVEVREEGLRVLEAAGIAVEPPADEPSPIRILKWTEALRRPPKATGALDLPEQERTYASMWQDLYLGRKSNEAEYLNGEIVELGKRLGRPTPYNSMLLEIINRMVAEGQKPGIHTPAELHALINGRA